MNKIYSREFALRTSDFDCRMQIKPSAVLDLFQEVAGAHANELGIGFDELLKKQLLWALVKVKFEIVNQIKMHQSVIVKTWPLPAGRITLQREYIIETLDGTPLVFGSSEWVTMHSEKRRIVPSTDIYPLQEFCEDKMFEGKFVKVPDFTVDFPSTELFPTFCDLDMNGHVNNIRYADYVLNALNLSDESIKAFQLDFHREVQKDTKLSIFLGKNVEQVLAKGVNDRGEKMFSCGITLY